MEWRRVLGITAGLSLDLTTHDPDDGKPWDFTKSDKRAKAMKKVEDKEALLLIGSPLCTVFSQLQTQNKNKRDPDKLEEEKRNGRQHLEFCMRLYNKQMDGGKTLST